VAQTYVAKGAIHDITKSRRKHWIHAMARWPEAVDLSIWPYALHYAVHLHNTVRTLGYGFSKELFSGTKVGSCTKDYHTFTYPVFSLQNSLNCNLSCWHQVPDCWCTYHGSHTKQLCMSSNTYMWAVTFYAFHQDHSEGVLDFMCVLVIFMYPMFNFDSYDPYLGINWVFPEEFSTEIYIILQY
jgi:hypothetical protein